MLSNRNDIDHELSVRKGIRIQKSLRSIWNPNKIRSYIDSDGYTIDHDFSMPSHLLYEATENLTIWLTEKQAKKWNPKRIKDFLISIYTQTRKSPSKKKAVQSWVDLLKSHLRSKLKDKKIPYVYFIKKDKFVKIGRSTNPERRLHALQTGTNQKLELLCKVPFLEENEIHARFESYRDHNEWFYLSNEILDFIKKEQAEDYSFLDDLFIDNMEE